MATLFLVSSSLSTTAEANPWKKPELQLESGVELNIKGSFYFFPTLKFSSLLDDRAGVTAFSVAILERRSRHDFLELRFGLGMVLLDAPEMVPFISLAKQASYLRGYFTIYGKQEILGFENGSRFHGLYKGDIVLHVPGKLSWTNLLKVNDPEARYIFDLLADEDEDFKKVNPLQVNVGIHVEHFGWDVAWGPHIGLSRFRDKWKVELQYLHGSLAREYGKTVRLATSWYF